MNFGPQKQPSSVYKIEAEVKSIKKVLSKKMSAKDAIDLLNEQTENENLRKKHILTLDHYENVVKDLAMIECFLDSISKKYNLELDYYNASCSMDRQELLDSYFDIDRKKLDEARRFILQDQTETSKVMNWIKKNPEFFFSGIVEALPIKDYRINRILMRLVFSKYLDVCFVDGESYYKSIK